MASPARKISVSVWFVLSAFQRVLRPRGGINEWLHWLPVSVHKKLDHFIRQIFGGSGLKVEGKKGMPLLGKKNGLLHVLEADAKQIAKVARETFDQYGPLLVIASGRDTISIASSIKRFAPENVFVVQIQHPRSRLDRFDLVIAPRHDYYSLNPQARQQIPWLVRRWITPCEPPGKNVVLTVGALHQADFAALRSAASAWHEELASLPKPLLVVNIGGPSSNCRYGVDLAKQLATMLQNVLWSCGSVRISFSRRTPKKVSKLLMEEFNTHPKVYIWDGEGPNPHLGHLAWADAFVITADSVSMLSEACSIGKPVYVIGADRCTWKFADFQKSLAERGVVRPFTDIRKLELLTPKRHCRGCKSGTFSTRRTRVENSYMIDNVKLSLGQTLLGIFSISRQFLMHLFIYLLTPSFSGSHVEHL
ncbi:mitochondrial fission protein ELM1-like isoform X2 [Momordica charantia]|uniref:Mitochondrial fission protein ELM1-like isoform X2 n=1 Tax=Momordica charantia TaxID=3673 RepID=A0A6J1CUN4_MOMCH|nr:mitochondrial fission protein ELM1-like isoform X2 [Momordica charantia]